MDGALGILNGTRNPIGDRRRPGPAAAPTETEAPGRTTCGISAVRCAAPIRDAGKRCITGALPSVLSMGLFRIRGVVYSLEDERRSQEMELVVDTGATYPVVPASVAEHLGIRPSEDLTLANGTRLPRKVGWAGLAYDGRKTQTRIVFGEAVDVPLLGAFALEGLGAEVDPVARTLRPATQYLL